MGVGQAPQTQLGAPGTALGAPLPSASGGLNRLLPLGAIGAVVLIGVAIMLTLHLGGPAKASDGSFQVQAPRGWTPSTRSEVDGYPVILALQTVASNGAAADFAVADFGQQIPLSTIEDNWQVVASSSNLAQSGRFGALTRTTVGGAPALTVDYVGNQFSGQLLFVDYANKTYIVALQSGPSDFGRLRGTDFAQILSSWEWLH